MDIWSAGCIAYELACGEILFNPRLDDEDDLLAHMQEALGRFPKELLRMWRRRSECYYKFFSDVCFSLSHSLYTRPFAGRYAAQDQSPKGVVGRKRAHAEALLGRREGHALRAFPAAAPEVRRDDTPVGERVPRTRVDQRSRRLAASAGRTATAARDRASSANISSCSCVADHYLPANLSVYPTR